MLVYSWKKIYQNIVRNCLQPTSQNKWNIKLNLSINFEWKKVYNLPYMITKDCNLRWFQYKLVHRILASNTYLYKFGLKEIDCCSFCKTNPETLEHLFYECDHVKYFWYELSNCLKTHCTHLREISLSVTDILFGKYWKIDYIDTLNFIILIAKYYINKCRYNNERLQINNFRKYLLFWYKVEKQVEFTNCNWEHFDKRWNLYYYFINNL